MSSADLPDGIIVLVGTAARHSSDVTRAAPNVPLVVAPDWDCVRAFVDRLAPQVDMVDDAIRLGDVEVEPKARKVAARGKTITLSEREFDLLTALCSDLERAWAFGELYEEVWRAPYLGDATAVRSAVKRLVHKFLEAGVDPPVESVRGFGFRVAANGSAK